MKTYAGLFGAFLLCLSTSFKASEACEYAGSNVGFVKSQTQKALAMEDINLARFHAYKALNAIVKSKQQLSECGCHQAALSIEEGLTNLKRATRATSLGATKILLNRALEDTNESLEALVEHEMHQSPYGHDVLVMNTTKTSRKEKASMNPDFTISKKKIDQSLLAYEKSLDQVIHSVECKEAREFAQRIYEHCEQQLLTPGLSELKKYYNLRTKDITAQALGQLEGCMP